MADERAEGDIDWDLTTFAGARHEQMRRWAALPLEEIVRALEEMENLVEALRGDERPDSGATG